MKTIKRLSLIVLAISILIPLGPVRADSAPPRNPPGGDVSPEGGTEVQMLAEQVIIDFRQSTDDSAYVSAWFIFHNTSDKDENMNVRFPLNGDEQGSVNSTTGEFFTYYPLIQDFTAAIGGQNLSTQVVKDTDPNAAKFFLNGYGDMYWSVFAVNFPAGKDVKLTVNYTFRPTEAENYAEIFYVLATGAGWKGPIGTADVIIRFPYILNDINLLDYYDELSGMLSSFWRKTMTAEENEIRIHWENLEPTGNDNVSFGVLQPKIWQEILRRRLQVIGSPDDASAWEALAQAYAAAGQEKHGMFSNPKLASLYILACERALTLNPKNVSLHIEFAENMFYADLGGNNDYYHALASNELATALKLDPTNAELLDFLQNYGDYYSITLTTPGPFPTQAQPTATTDWEPTFTLTSTWIPSLTQTLASTPVLPATTTFIQDSTPTQQPVAAETTNKDSAPLMVLTGFLFVAAGFVTWRSVRSAKNQ